MGMASSQARLLTLTARLHDIEYKAARLEAQKLQMANESTRVYEDYLRALDATSVQVGILGTDGSTNYINATLAILEGADIDLNKNIYLVDSASDKVYITKALADKYNLDDSGSIGSLEDFMANAGYDVIIPGYTTAANAILTTYTGVGVETDDAGSRIVSNLSSSMGYQAVTPGSHVYTTTTIAELDADTVSSIIANDAFDANTTYNISTAEELYQLLTLVNTNHIDTTGINFVLTDDIDLSDYNWTGIGTSGYQFKGNFDGNGYTISNLTGKNGLFAYVTGNASVTTDKENGVTVDEDATTYGIIENVYMDNVNITATSNAVGALIGFATGAYVNNCYTSGSISAGNWSGGLIGENDAGIILNSTANVALSCSGTCVGGFIGHDASGIIQNCISTGSVSGSGYVGGFIGHETSIGSNCGSSFIYGCATTTTSSKSYTGAFIGVIDSNCGSTIIGCLYSSDLYSKTVHSNGGTLVDDGNGDSLADGATKTVDTIDVTLPTLESVESNIALLLEQAGITDVVSDEDIQNWLNQFYEGTSDLYTINKNVLTDDALKLASINEYICEALSSGGNSDLVAALIADITSGSTSNTVSYQDKFVPTREYEYTPYEADESELASKQNDLTIPSIENIAKNLYTALYNAGYSVSSQDDVDAIIEWMELNYSTDTEEGKLALANLNDYITNCINNSGSSSSELENIYNAIVNGTSYTLPESECAYVAGDNNSYTITYTITVADYEQTCEATYDMSNQNVIDAINFWEVAHKGGYIIVSDELANSNEWLTNMINSGTTILVEVDKNKEVNNFETSVSTNTSLQEVSNEVMLKKAEAKYEADMKKIDLKDRKYDTDLAAIENEREAIKNEIETLKTVAKDNVERTFKLFS